MLSGDVHKKKMTTGRSWSCITDRKPSVTSTTGTVRFCSRWQALRIEQSVGVVSISEAL